MPTKEELEKLSKAVAQGKVPQIKGVSGITEKAASILGSGAGGTAPTTATPNNNPDVPYLSETNDGISKTPAVPMPAGYASSSNSENPDAAGTFFPVAEPNPENKAAADAAIANFADVSSNNMLDALTSTESPATPPATPTASTQAQDAARNAAGTLKAGELFGSAAYGKPIVPPKFAPNTAQPADLSPDSVNDLSYSDFKTPFVEGKAPAAPPKSYVVQPEKAPTFDPNKMVGDRSPRAMALAQMGFNRNKLRLEREARTAGRKDFAAALDAAGYDPSTASAKDKATFYAQGKELGLSSKQIDKYALDRAEKIAKQKDRIKNPDKYRQPSSTAAAAAAQVAGGANTRMPMELPPISQAGPYRPPQTQAGPARPYQARNYYPPS